MTIKIQVEGGASTNSAIEAGFENCHLPLTFLAYSDTMKARVLEIFLKSPSKVGISIFDGQKRDGEWHEAFAPNAIFNK